MIEIPTDRLTHYESWMDDVATMHANKVTENKSSIYWVDFWQSAYNEKMCELQICSLKKAG